MAGDSLWRRWRRAIRRDARLEFEEELRYHIEERVRDHIARGMDRESAERAVLERLGDLDPVREQCVGLMEAEWRQAERRRWLGVSWLDVKLGLRMLVKHPGLTVVGGVGIAVAIAVGASVFGIIYSMLDPVLPLEGGDRVVKIQEWDAASGNTQALAVHDFEDVRDALRSVAEVSAYRRSIRNVIGGDGRVEPFRVTAMSAAGFRVAGVPALMGRALLAEDEVEGAPAVVVIGYDVWRNRFASDPGILGRSLRLGDASHTIVGVMPSGFAFPENDRFWTALRLNPSVWARGEGPRLEVFGRLAQGATLESAQAELAAVGAGLAAAYPATHEPFGLRLQPYTHAFNEPGAWVFHFVQLLITMLLVVVCVNVAVLTYARTVTRRGEITVRNALGASRARITGQLFVESFILAGTAALVGLGLAWVALRRLDLLLKRTIGDQLPFWFDFHLSPSALLYVGGLVILAAVITGVVPALKATGGQVSAGLQQLSGGGTGFGLGRTWTALIVAQVAIAVGALPVAVATAWENLLEGGADPGFAAADFMSIRLQLDREDPGRDEAETYERDYIARYADLQTELMRRMEADPSISAVTFAARAPGWEPSDRIELEAESGPSDSGVRIDPDMTNAGMQGDGLSGPVGFRVGVGRVAPGYFAAFEVPLLSGRSFEARDLDAATGPILVNQSFVEEIGRGAGVVGRRIRYARPEAAGDEGDAPRWFEIVGVVSDFPARVDPDQARARIYLPAGPGDIYPADLSVRVRDPGSTGVAAQLRALAAGVDPRLRLDDIRPLLDVNREERSFNRMFSLALAAVTLSVLLLSAAGIHALMSFTVARRRREIGIRAALGADPGDVLRGIFARAAWQLAIGLFIGLFLAAAFFRVASDGDAGLRQIATSLLLVSAIMLVTGLLAALGPAREGLSVQPTEALREG